MQSEGKGTTIDARFSVRAERRRLSPEIEIAALRIGREAVVNAVKHANANVIEVALAYEPELLRPSVRDDGRGLPRAQLNTAVGSGHWGVAGMRERALQAGGTLEITGAGAAGTTVSLTVPSKELR